MAATMTRWKIAPAILGAVAALYLLGGRWSPGRLVGEGAEASIFLELRLWVVLALVLVAVCRRGVRAGQTRASTGIWWPTAAYLGYLAVTALWAPDGALGLEKCYEVALVAGATFACITVLEEGDADARTFVTAFWAAVLGLGGLMALVALAQAVRGGAGERLAVLGGGPNVFGRTMGLFAIASLFAWRRIGRAWLFLPFVGVALLLVVLSGSRGGFVALTFALACFVAFEARSLVRIVIGSILILGVLWAVVAQTEIGQTALERYQRRIEVQLLQEQYMSGRDDLYASALALGVSAPLFGGGLAAFPALGLGVYPHNVFLEAFCEGGGVAVALLLAALAVPAVRVLRRRGAVDGASASAFVLILVASQFSGDFYDNSRGLFLLLVFAILTPLSSGSSAKSGAVSRRVDAAVPSDSRVRLPHTRSHAQPRVA